ncbi:hypothetical protein RFI_12881 [Reticulomyxa filosa]|uniref:Uncharacterized protein n=1 Tax=Reticulomyxa filosa TaxID=46433 RepID=X6NG10_RETFI|nr:hypothetical protein RFI_12881 [Reticulomyxa filosa]|eukprot:ETO24277.1 hypothetical protein RFI_12881 [Reticulomyxa filosa]
MKSICKEKYRLWYYTNTTVELIIEQLKKWYPGYATKFEQFKHFDAKVGFLINNYDRLLQIAEQHNAPWILQYLQSQKGLINDIDKIVVHWDKKCQSSSFLTKSESARSSYQLSCQGYYLRIMEKVFRFTKNNCNADDMLTPDPLCYNLTLNQLLMRLFILYMDGILSPTVIFHHTHYLQIPLSKIRQLDTLKKIQRVSIVCVSFNRSFMLYGDSSTNAYFPYYFLIFEKSLLNKSRHRYHHTFLMHQQSHNTDLEAWYPHPGENNVFYCIGLFALFIHTFLNNHLDGVNLENTPFLETVLDNK